MKEVILYSNGFKPDKVFKEKMKRICGENAKETDIEVRFSSEMIEHVKSNLQKYYDHCSYYTGEDNTLAWIGYVDDSKYWTIKKDACHLENAERVVYLDVVFMDGRGLNKYNYINFDML